MVNRENYAIVKSYLKYLKEVHQISESSVDRYWYCLRHLLLWAEEAPLSKIKSIRPTFPVHLAGRLSAKALAPSTQKRILDVSKRFLNWAKDNYAHSLKGISGQYIDTLRMLRQPQLTKENVYVSLEEVKKLISVPSQQNDLALLRDKAAAAFLFISGIRAGAFVTMPISSLHLDTLAVYQWPELGVKTKNGKRATTFLYDIPYLLAPIMEWDAIVRSQLPETAVWYSPVISMWGEQNLSTEKPGKNRVQALGKRLRNLFSLANLEYKSAHKFRHGHAVFGLKNSRTMAEYKAVSQNLMHENIETTDSIYAPLRVSEIQQKISGLTVGDNVASSNEFERYLESLSHEESVRALQIIGQNLQKMIFTIQEA